MLKPAPKWTDNVELIVTVLGIVAFGLAAIQIGRWVLTG